MARSRVQVTNGFPAFRKRLHAAARAGAEAGEAFVVESIKADVPLGDGESGVLPGHARDTIGRQGVKKTRRGYSGGAIAQDPTIVWLDKGTHGRRATRNSQASREIRRKFLRQTKAGRSSGIRPRRFGAKAAKAAMPVMLAAMKSRAKRLL